MNKNGDPVNVSLVRQLFADDESRTWLGMSRIIAQHVPPDVAVRAWVKVAPKEAHTDPDRTVFGVAVLLKRVLNKMVMRGATRVVSTDPLTYVVPKAKVPYRRNKPTAFGKSYWDVLVAIRAMNKEYVTFGDVATWVREHVPQDAIRSYAERLSCRNNTFLPEGKSEDELVTWATRQILHQLLRSKRLTESRIYRISDTRQVPGVIGPPEPPAEVDECGSEIFRSLSREVRNARQRSVNSVTVRSSASS